MNKNSLLNSPTPSASFFTASTMSSGSPAFADIIILSPVRDFSRTPRSFSSLSCSFSDKITSSLYAATVFSSGSMHSEPSFPFSTAVLPFHSSGIFPTETTAGMPIILARIAVCDISLPTSVTNPRTFPRSSVTVSAGLKSSEATITRSSSSKMLVSPISTAHSLSVSAFTSAARCFMYSDSIDESISDSCSPAFFTAKTAPTPSSFIIRRASPMKSSSSSINLYTSKIDAPLSPIVDSAFSYSRSFSLSSSATAFFNLSISSSDERTSSSSLIFLRRSSMIFPMT